MKVINRAANSLLYRLSRKYLLGKFDFWEQMGIHIVQNNYYSSIPNLADLRKKIDSFEKQIDMSSFDWNEQTQSKLIEDIFPHIL